MAKFSTLSSGVSSRTSSHFTSSSSAMTCAKPVPMCWPISALRMCIVVLPSGVIVNQIDGVNAGMPAPIAALALPLSSRLGSPMLMNVPAAVAAERTKKSRRVIPVCVGLAMAYAPFMSSAARFTAPTMRGYVAQRHRLPFMPSTICCSLGLGLADSSAAACMICPD